MAAGSYDFIICTSPGLSDLTALIALLRPKGTLCLVGIPSAHFTFPARELIDYQKSIAGSPIGSPATIAEMLRVVVETGVRPRVEGFGMTQINAALQRLDAGQLRYRAVLNQDL
jgi:uncharacterized zinc-type alcohol dehydrogenase-like protein